MRILLARAPALCVAVALLATSVILPATASGASNGDESAFWAYAGVGPASLGVGGILGVSWQQHKFIVSARGVSVAEVLGDEFWDIGLLMGVAKDTPGYHASISTGVAIVGGSRSASIFASSISISETFGVPVEAHVTWRPLRNVGLGLGVYADLNPEQSFIGATAVLQLGKLR
jgi:hypothetical protein